MESHTTAPSDGTTISPKEDSNLLDAGPGSIGFLVFLSIFGSFGNIVILSAILTDKKLHSFTDVFVFNVAVMDLIMTLLWIPAMVPNLINKQLIYSDQVCSIFGMLLVSLACSSLISLAIVAANRYVFICYRGTYKQIFNKVSVACLTVATWVYGPLLTLPTLLGWGRFRYIEAAALCIMDHKKSISNFLFVSGIVLGIPTAVTFYCYGKIGYVLYKSRMNIESHNQGGKSCKKQKHNTTVFTMFIISAVFTVIWLPYIVTSAVDFLTPVSPILVRVTAWMGLISSCGNSVVLTVTNKYYRTAFRNIFCCIRDKYRANNRIITVTKNTE